MSIPTAEEFLSKNIDYVLENDCKGDVESAMIEFAKLHVEAALKEASDNAKVIVNPKLRQTERMYSEEDMRIAFFSAIKITGEGWNGEYANGNNPNVESKFNSDYIEWFEQFKKK